MRVSSSTKKSGDLPHILFKRGLVRQGFRHKMPVRPQKQPDTTYVRHKRMVNPVGRKVKYKRSVRSPSPCGCNK